MEKIVYFIILFVLIYFYNKRSGMGWIKNLSEVAKEKKIKTSDIIDNEGRVSEKLEDDAKGYFLDTKVLGWIIIAYIIFGIIEYFSP
tara:strand:- start:60 stop:320 length:261 start_codon:yes stop_codon:yes gene_type:complete